MKARLNHQLCRSCASSQKCIGAITAVDRRRTRKRRRADRKTKKKRPRPEGEGPGRNSAPVVSLHKYVLDLCLCVSGRISGYVSEARQETV